MTLEIRAGQTYTQGVWKQERFVLYYHSTAAGREIKMWTSFIGSSASPIAKYKTNIYFDAYIDMTDYVRAYSDRIGTAEPYTHTIYVQDESATAIEIKIGMLGLINPTSVLLPYQKMFSYGAKIIPPTMFYLPQYQNAVAEIYSASASFNVTGSANIMTGNRRVNILGDYVLTCAFAQRAYKARKTMCGVEYASVKWVSFTGQIRTHSFEITKRKTETQGTISLIPKDDDYSEIKGRVDGVTLRLDGLDMYDLWYYSDILHSSKVEIGIAAWSHVAQITDKAITLPDGDAGTNGVLEIQLNFAHYDAVAM